MRNVADGQPNHEGAARRKKAGQWPNEGGGMGPGPASAEGKEPLWGSYRHHDLNGRRTLGCLQFPLCATGAAINSSSCLGNSPVGRRGPLINLLVNMAAKKRTSFRLFITSRVAGSGSVLAAGRPVRAELKSLFFRHQQIKKCLLKLETCLSLGVHQSIHQTSDSVQGRDSQ